MVPFTSYPMLSTLMCIASVSGDSLEESHHFQNQRNITAESGQNVLLPCRAPDSEPVVAVEWNRADLGSEYVLLYRNNQIDLEVQHQSFRNRVDLLDRQLKNGNASLILRNMTTDDGETYRCEVVQTVANSRRKTVVMINLDVRPPPGEPDGVTKDGRVALGVALMVGLGLVLAIVFLGIYLYRKRLRSKQSQQHTEELPERQKHLITQNGSAQL